MLVRSRFSRKIPSTGVSSWISLIISGNLSHFVQTTFGKLYEGIKKFADDDEDVLKGALGKKLLEA